MCSGYVRFSCWFLSVLFFAVAVNVFMKWQIDKINMAESLKTVE